MCPFSKNIYLNYHRNRISNVCKISETCPKTALFRTLASLLLNVTPKGERSAHCFASNRIIITGHHCQSFLSRERSSKCQYTSFSLLVVGGGLERTSCVYFSKMCVCVYLGPYVGVSVFFCFERHNKEEISKQGNQCSNV